MVFTVKLRYFNNTAKKNHGSPAFPQQNIEFTSASVSSAKHWDRSRQDVHSKTLSLNCFWTEIRDFPHSTAVVLKCSISKADCGFLGVASVSKVKQQTSDFRYVTVKQTLQQNMDFSRSPAFPQRREKKYMYFTETLTTTAEQFLGVCPI